MGAGRTTAMMMTDAEGRGLGSSVGWEGRRISRGMAATSRID